MNTVKIQVYLKKCFFFLVAAISLSLPAYSWDDVYKTHQAMTQHGFKLFLNKAASNRKYSGCRYRSDAIFTGVSIEKWNSIFMKKMEVKSNFEGWLTRAATAADNRFDEKYSYILTTVGSAYSGLRHFYSPNNIKTPGARWLTDEYYLLLENIIEKVNPCIDAITWGTSYTSNAYSWNNSLVLYKAAMENTIPANSSKYSLNGSVSREKLFAASYRALGETLHILQDMTVPAHVRNDAHTKPDVDTMENTIYENTVNTIMNGITPGWYTSDAGNISGLTTAELMAKTAQFTNENFFSDDTIQGKNIQPKHPSVHTFPKPLLDDCSRETTKKLLLKSTSFYRNFSGYGSIPMAQEKLSSKILQNVGNLLNVNINSCHIPADFAKKQAGVLIPIAVFGSSEILDRFFPTITLNANLATNNGVSTLVAKMVHLINQDICWKASGLAAIEYSGPGEIWVNGKKAMDVTFQKGSMPSVSSGNVKSGDKIEVRVLAGACEYRSPVLTVSAK
ncbi:MAG: hypothetical protein HQM10_21830 [Candidatus Riflebacteria bacterium]|nr:hypothetical protein [Candidatus Riflebacteria bacterium]